MIHHALKMGLIVAVLALAASNADAFGHRRGCGYGYGGYGCGAYGCGYGYGYGYGGYGYGYPGYGWYAANAASGTSAAMARTASQQPSSVAPLTSTSMRLTVTAPADARVIINDRPTTSTGELRRYTSTGLQPGLGYDYRVRAEFVRDGQPVVEEKTVQVKAGQEATLTFAPSAASQVATAEPAPQR